MITVVNSSNMEDYTGLYDEARDILSGYKRVRTFDKNQSTYYYRNDLATNKDELFVPLEILDLRTFANYLANHGILYIKVSEDPVDGFDPMLKITTLEEYFSWIRILGTTNRKYTMLPLDEEPFEINANTRAIQIPPNFKKNGIAVQGDDLAEVVYFKIDRYFDYMDFNNCDIFIQWETPKTSDGTINKGISAAYVRDIESEPGKLIFGWAISDAVTGQSGNLKFSVRFFQWEDADEANSGKGALAYSFNTLSANVSIQPSLGFDLEKEYDPDNIDDVGARLIGRLVNSEIAGGYAAATPIFIKNLNDPNEDCIYDLICLNPEAPEEEQKFAYDLLVHAYSEDTGAISYVWKYQALNKDTNDPEGNEIDTSVVENYMFEIEDLASMVETDYPYNIYKLNGSDQNGKPIYTLYRGPIPPSVEEINKGLQLFEKHSIFTATEAGQYWAIAENRLTNSSKYADSLKAVFPHPDPITVIQGLEEQVHLVDIEDDPDLGPIAKLEVKVADPDSTVQVKGYKWYRDENHGLHFDGNQANWELLPNEVDATLVTALPGHYKVVVSSTRNNSTRYEEKIPIARVTNLAPEPQLLVLDTDKKEYQISALSSENCPTVRMDANVESDYYIVDWYLNEDEGKLIHTDDLANGVYRASFNPRLYEEKILSLTTQGNNIEGSYYAIVTNNVNGSQFKTSKPSYDNMFKITY